MKKVYLIHAYESIYSGLHGMETYQTVESEWTYDELCDYGNELAGEVQESYEDIMNNYDDIEDEDERYEAMEADKIYCIYECKCASMDEADALIDELGLDQFIEEYCIDVEDKVK